MLSQKHSHCQQSPKMPVSRKRRQVKRGITAKNPVRKRIHFPICLAKRTTSDWHFMDHVAKKHQSKRALLSTVSDTKGTSRHRLKGIFNKYTHVREANKWTKIREEIAYFARQESKVSNKFTMDSRI